MTSLGWTYCLDNFHGGLAEHHVLRMSGSLKLEEEVNFALMS